MALEEVVSEPADQGVEDLPPGVRPEEPEPKVPEPLADKPKGPEPKEPEPKEKPKDPKPKKRGPAREPKVQCPTCLRYHCGWRVHSGGHVCHPVRLPEPKPVEPNPVEPKEEPKEDPEDEPDPSSGREPMAQSMVAPEPRLTHSDVARFMARERMNRHERKRQRWQDQMFG